MWPWRSVHSRPRSVNPRRRDGEAVPQARRRLERGRKERKATGMSEARSCRAPWVKEAHARDSDAVRQKARGLVFEHDPPKRSSDVVKRPVPRSSRAEPQTPRDAHAAKVATGAGNATRCGYTLLS